MRLTNVMLDHGVLRMPDAFEEYVGHLQDDPYLQDCILLGAADIWLRDVAVAPFVEGDDAVLVDEGPTVRHLLLARLTKDCSPLSDSCPHQFGPEEAFTFTGDLIKWQLFGGRTLGELGGVAQRLTDGMGGLGRAGNPGEEWVRRQTAVWSAELLNSDAQQSFGVSPTTDPTEPLERALADLGFRHRGHGTLRV